MTWPLTTTSSAILAGRRFSTVEKQLQRLRRTATSAVLNETPSPLQFTGLGHVRYVFYRNSLRPAQVRCVFDSSPSLIQRAIESMFSEHLNCIHDPLQVESSHEIRFLMCVCWAGHETISWILREGMAVKTVFCYARRVGRSRGHHYGFCHLV